MTDTPVNPLELLIKSQQAALKLTADVLQGVREAAVAGIPQPEDTAKQIGDLASALAGMTGMVTSLAGATAQPLQDFITRQRELADTVRRLAEAQSELATVVAALAERHAQAVSALEQLTTPVLAMVGRQPTERGSTPGA